MRYYGNHLIDGDDGLSPHSPYYKEKEREDDEIEKREDESEANIPFRWSRAVKFWDNINIPLLEKIYRIK